jgi:ribosomal-protein-alanine N-acetyltransferase
MADLVWYIIPTVRGKGYMTEAGKAVVKFLQNTGFDRIEAFADVENIESIKVMEKIGMQYEGTLRKYDCRRDDTLYDAKMYSIIK